MAGFTGGAAIRVFRAGAVESVVATRINAHIDTFWHMAIKAVSTFMSISMFRCCKNGWCMAGTAYLGAG